MWGDLIDVTGIDADLLRAQRARLRLSQREAAKRMFGHLARLGPAARDGIALSGKGFTWSTESACLRAVSELENRKRVMKEEQYVYSLLAVLGLAAEQVGLVAPAQPLAAETIAAVEGLPAGVRGVMSNMHGELLVYTQDDVLHHSDMDWQPRHVSNGTAHEIVLDVHERDFVEAMWRQGEEVRKLRRLSRASPDASLT